MDRFDPSSMRESMKLDFGGGSTQVPTPTAPAMPTEKDSLLESPGFLYLLNQLSKEKDTAQDILQKNTFKAPQYKSVQQLPTPTPTSLLFPDQPPSNDQLQYAQGFLDALKTVHQANSFKQMPLNSPSVLDTINTLKFLSPQASPVTQIRPISDFDALLNAMNRREKEAESSRDSGASTSSPPRPAPPAPSISAASAAAAAVASAAAQQRLQQAQQPPQPPAMPFYSAAAAAAAASGTSSVPPPSVGPSETSLNNSSDEDSESDSDSRSKGAGSAPPRSRSTVKKDISGMDDQEAKKLERKRLRNRQAATKCRQKKLARISELEQQVNQEKEHAKQLDYNLDMLRKQVRSLEQAIQVHAGSGCQLH
ncbi:hypothetical protein PMAYCL1PPCAC_05424 [Pristionchus mayeri]|uniref:BZIP domain-containing protein n=1 Tax=Pristionchus mayeri TaxID=1317129 RepID=A0AAN4Z8B6_9BILA|nr:hypothetical protein PMAYCL1PPCAC_05424 [Pristionchus mayeri]